MRIILENVPRGKRRLSPSSLLLMRSPIIPTKYGSPEASPHEACAGTAMSHVKTAAASSVAAIVPLRLRLTGELFILSRGCHQNPAPSVVRGSPGPLSVPTSIHHECESEKHDEL